MEIALAVRSVLSIPVVTFSGSVIAIGARKRGRALEQGFADFRRSCPISAAANAVPQQLNFNAHGRAPGRGAAVEPSRTCEGTLGTTRDPVADLARRRYACARPILPDA